MGTPKLKAKAERDYRKGLTWKDCSGCDYFVSDFEVRSCGGDNKVLKTEGRCKVIGLKHGRSYRILPHYLCDDHDGCKKLARLKKGLGPIKENSNANTSQ